MVWKKIWTVLNTEIKWPDGTETVKGGVDATKALLELAKEDFQAVLDSGYLDKREKEKQRRERWVKVLEAGENPFTPEELQALRRNYGLSDG